MAESMIGTHDIQWKIGSNGLAMPVLVARPTERFPQSGRLFVSILRARKLYDTKSFGKMSTYVTLKLDQQSHKTAVCRKGGKQPHWGESCILTVRGDEQEQVLRVRVYSKGMMGKAIVGTAIIPLDALISTSIASANQTGRLRAVSAAPPPSALSSTAPSGSSSSSNGAPPTPSRASTQVGPKAFPVTPAAGRSLGKGFDVNDSKSFEDDDLEAIGRWFDLGREDSNLIPAGAILLAVTFAPDPTSTRTRAESAPVAPAPVSMLTLPMSPAPQFPPATPQTILSPSHAAASAATQGAAAIAAVTAITVGSSSSSSSSSATPANNATPTSPDSPTNRSIGSAARRGTEQPKTPFVTTNRRHSAVEVTVPVPVATAVVAKKSSEVKEKVKLFGGPLSHGMRRSKGTVPVLCFACVQYLTHHGLSQEGLFRVPGQGDMIQTLKNQFEKGDSVILLDVNATAGVLKLYLRELAEPLVPFALYEPFLHAAEEDIRSEERRGGRPSLSLAADPHISTTAIPIRGSIMVGNGSVAATTTVTGASRGLVSIDPEKKQRMLSKKERGTLRKTNLIAERDKLKLAKERLTKLKAAQRLAKEQGAGSDGGRRHTQLLFETSGVDAGAVATGVASPAATPRAIEKGPMAALSAAGRRSNVSSPSHSPVRNGPATIPPLILSTPTTSSSSSSSTGAPLTPSGPAPSTTGFVAPSLAAAATATATTASLSAPTGSGNTSGMTYTRLAAEVRKLPADHHTVLSYIIHFLTKVAANVRVNKMDAKNCGMVLGPNLIRPPPLPSGAKPQDMVAMTKELSRVQLCCAMLIEGYTIIFPDGPPRPFEMQHPTLDRPLVPRNESHVRSPVFAPGRFNGTLKGAIDAVKPVASTPLTVV